MSSTLNRPFLLVAVVACVAACARTPSPAPSEGGAPPVRVHVVDGGAPPDARTTCGETLCREPVEGSPLAEVACCLPSLACGVRSALLGDRCLEPAQPGGVDPACPSVTAPNGATAAGCCTPSGRCGSYDRFGALGCVLVDETDAGVHCHYDPENACRSLVTVPCDGPEDCPMADVCCGRASYGTFDAFGCFPSCTAATNADRGVWSELCHSPADCRDPHDGCIAVDGLPSTIGRCRPVRGPDSGPPGETDGASRGPPPRDASREAGPDAADGSTTSGAEGVVCGFAQCEPGSACCRREPGDPYCVPRGQACTCEGPRPSDD